MMFAHVCLQDKESVSIFIPPQSYS